MSLLNEKDREKLIDRFEGLDQPVKLIVFSQDFECQYCRETRQIAEELAKLLVGSKSARISDYTNLPEFGRLAEYSRKAITFEIDILLQQKYLATDEHNKVILGSLIV